MERIRELSIRKESSIREGMQAIDRGACWIALIVDEGDKLLGLVTDGDIRRALLAGASLDGPVEPCMRTKFTAVPPTAARSEVLDLMRARSLNQIPIVEPSGRLVGLHLLREIIGAARRPNWAVIMAGGRGERLRPLTDTLPKPMVRVAGRPILERIVLHLVGFGIRRIFLSVNYLSEIIEKHFGDGAAYGCSIDYLRENQPLGTGGSLSLLPEKPHDPLLVLNGDLVTQFDVGGMLDLHEQGGHAITMGVRQYSHAVPYAVLDVADCRVTRLCEKPEVSWPVNAGIYLLNPSLLGRIPAGTPYSVPDLIETCLEKKESVGAFWLDDDWLDVGRHRELRQARGLEQ